MGKKSCQRECESWPALSSFPLPGKILFTAILLTMAVAMVGALGQIVVHDIIPTFFSNSGAQAAASKKVELTDTSGKERGDLFEGLDPTSVQAKTDEPYYLRDQFVWTLRWTHIHLFGMNMIFFFLGAVTLFLDTGWRARAWLIGLPFPGVVVDIAAVWLKNYVSPVFFWLHIPGGGLFTAVFLIVFVRAMKELWWNRPGDET
ncbi:MAG: hypothetical protein ACOWWM_16830 [Desulfobacterales bacterium]